MSEWVFYWNVHTRTVLVCTFWLLQWIVRMYIFIYISLCNIFLYNSNNLTILQTFCAFPTCVKCSVYSYQLSSKILIISKGCCLKNMSYLLQRVYCSIFAHILRVTVNDSRIYVCASLKNVQLICNLLCMSRNFYKLVRPLIQQQNYKKVTHSKHRQKVFVKSNL